MEELILTEPDVEPEKVKSSYKVIALTMNHEQAPMPPETVPGVMMIGLKDNLGGYLTHSYTGKAAQDYIKAINTGNFTTKSLHKKLLEKLSNDGIIPGTVQGTPDPPAREI